jgi:hypothetical protein
MSSRIAACLAVVALLSVAAANAAEVPAPLRTRDLKAWIDAIQPTDPQRVILEKAFDDCVDRWLEVRDQTVRPAQTKLDAAPDDEAAMTGMNKASNRAFEAMRTSERAMFDAMRAAGLDAAQMAALDKVADARTRKRATAMVRGVSMNLPRVPGLKSLPTDKAAEVAAKTRAWETTATPIIDRLALASLEDPSGSRFNDLRRKLLASQRATVREIATLLPPADARAYLESFRRTALPSRGGWARLGAPTPDGMMARMTPEQRGAMTDRLAAWDKEREALEEAAIDAMLADPPQPETVKELADRAAKLNAENAAAIAEAAGDPGLARPGMTFEIGGDEAGMNLEDLASEGSVMVLSSGSNDAVPAMTGAMVVMQADDEMPAEGGMIQIQSNIQVIATTSDASEIGMNAPPPDMEAAIAGGAAVARAVTDQFQGSTDQADGASNVPMPEMLLSRGTRPLSRQDVESMRTRLAVPDAQRAVWDALAEDLLKANSDWMAVGSANAGPAAEFMPAAGQTPEQFVQSRAARRAELARIEEGWFENVKAGVTGVDAGALASERARRALARARAGLQGMGPMMVTSLVSRPMKIDLDAAVAGLSPAGARACAAAVQAWRASLLQELVAAQALLDEASKLQISMMQSVLQQSEDGSENVSMNMTIDEKQAEALERARKPLEEAIARIEASQAAAVDTVAATLPAADALALRRAVRKQTHPEAFRSQEKVDAAVSRALAIADLSPDRVEAVSQLAEDFRTRSDVLVERSIERTDKSDAAMSGLLQGGPNDDPSRMMKQVRKLQDADRIRTDAAYDREELNARTLRRLRALLSPEQAAVVRLD